MKQPIRTLPQAVKLFPKSWKKVIQNSIPNNFYNLSYEEKLKFEESTNETYYCSFKDNKLFFGLKTVTIVRAGRTFYPKYSWSNTIVIENNKINVSKLTPFGLKLFLSLIKIDPRFIDELCPSVKSFLLKPIIIADILRKKIYSKETVCKAILSKIYRLKGFDWKLFYKYFESCYICGSLFDLKAFTKDLNTSLNILVNLEGKSFPIYRDLLDCAIKLNEVVDFTWSERRMREEHQRQINELNRKDIEAKEETPIFDVCLDEPNIHMLNTEKEVFLEGTNMHHCLYRCYWDKIKRKVYVAFHMTHPQDCTFSFRIVNDHVILDQAYLAYDQRVSEETRSLIMQFLERNRESLYKLLTKEEKEENPFIGMFNADDLPY